MLWAWRVFFTQSGARFARKKTLRAQPRDMLSGGITLSGIGLT